MKIIARGIQILPAVSAKTQGLIRSGPVDLDLFSLSNLFLTISGVISTVLSTGVVLPARQWRVKSNSGELKLYVISPAWRVKFIV